MEGKVYIATLETSYTWEECHDSTTPLGVFSTIELAEQIGENTLLEYFKYDEESGIFYGDYADEAYISIRECSINEAIDFDKRPVKCIPEVYIRKEGGAE